MRSIPRNSKKELAASEEISGQLSASRKLEYRIGGIADALPFNVISFYFFICLTGLLGITPSEAGSLLGLPIALMIPLDPLTGLLLDRERCRGGRRRRYILAFSPILASAAVRKRFRGMDHN